MSQQKNTGIIWNVLRHSLQFFQTSYEKNNNNSLKKHSTSLKCIPILSKNQRFSATNRENQFVSWTYSFFHIFSLKYLQIMTLL